MLLFYLAVIDGGEQKRTFEYYYLTYRMQMFAAAMSVLKNTADAEDAVHNAFLGLAKHIDVLLDASEENAKCYCIKASRNAALNIVRKNSYTDSTVSIEDMYDEADETALEDVLQNAEYQEVLNVVNSLDSVYRDVLYMHFVMDMPVKKIADVLDRKLSTVKQQLVRGKKMLISALKEEVMTAND